MDEAHGSDNGGETTRHLALAHKLARLAQWDLDVSTQTLAWTTTTSTIFGIPVTQLDAVPALLGWVDKRDRARVAGALAGADPTQLEFRLLPPDGRELILHCQFEPSSQQPPRLTGVMQDISELRRAERQAHQLAYFDSLTGLPNRAFLQRFLGHAISSARRNDHPLAVLALDLDLFKRVNDTLGHAAGDALLAEAGRRMEACIRGSDAAVRTSLDPEGSADPVASRLGGDEFVVVLTQLNRPEDAAMVARRINESLAQSFDLGGRQVFVSSSIGISMFPDNGTDVDTLLNSADAAMYHAKSSGRNTFKFFSAQLHEGVRRCSELDHLLRGALANTLGDGPACAAGELLLHYQPKLRLPDQRVTGVEALVRWRGSDGTLIPPGDFIPAAEQSGLICKLGEWVLRAACRQAASWNATGMPLAVAVNVSPRQLLEPNFLEVVTGILAETGLAPELLELEVTEAAAMTDQSAGNQILSELVHLGVRIALDDFGTGYSSLSWLARLPIDSLKIDRTFVQALGDRDKNDAVIQTIIELAARLGIGVVAEGVETVPQLRQLETFGAIQVQGYLFARPMPAGELAAWLLGHTSAPRRPSRMLARVAEAG